MPHVLSSPADRQCLEFGSRATVSSTLVTMGPWLPHTKVEFGFPRRNWYYEEGQKHAFPDQTDEKCACLWLHNTKGGKSGLVEIEIRMLARLQEKHRDKPPSHAHFALSTLPKCRARRHCSATPRGNCCFPQPPACCLQEEGRLRGRGTGDAAACSARWQS